MEDKLEDFLNNKQLPIPFQNAEVESLESKSKLLPRIKLIEVEDYQTHRYKIVPFFKNISAIIDPNK